MTSTRGSRRSRTDILLRGGWSHPSAPLWVVGLLLAVPWAQAGASAMAHTVVRGESLWTIAQTLTGQSAHWRLLQRANRLPDPNRLQPGQVLQVPTHLLALPETSATVVHVHGDVRVLLPGARDVEALRVGVEVPEGARVDVGERSYARLRLADGSAFGLSAGSSARLLRLRLDAGTQQSQTLIRMEAGRVESDVAPRRHPGSRFEVHTPMAVASVRGTRFGVSTSGDVSTSEVHHGEVGLSRPHRAQGGNPERRAPVVLMAGQGARIEGRGAIQRAVLLPAPDLSGLPAEFDDGDQVQFTLPVSPQAQAYRVQVRDANAPDAVLRETWSREPQLALAGLGDGQYILVLQHVDTLGLLGRTSRHGFSVQPGPVPPLLRHPEPGEKVTGSTLSLRCTEPVGVVGYHMQVARDADFREVMLDRSGLDSCQLTTRLAMGRYHWRVAALSAANKAGPFGAPASFELVSGLIAEAPSADPDARLTAHWPSQSGVSYRVQVALDAAFTQSVFDGWLPGTRLELPGAQPGVPHFLRWQSRDAQGRLSPLSPTHRLLVGSAGLQTGDGGSVKTGTDVAPPRPPDTPR